jgi:hypothetical protein
MLIVALIILFILLLWGLMSLKDQFLTGPHPLRDLGRNWTNIQNKRCQDAFIKCPWWASAGECRYNPKWMFKYCPYSCGVCDAGECERKLMEVESKVFDQQKNLIPCVDYESGVNCQKWAHQGWCEKYPYYMSKNCESTCNFCKYNLNFH